MAPKAFGAAATTCIGQKSLRICVRYRLSTELVLQRRDRGHEEIRPTSWDNEVYGFQKRAPDVTCRIVWDRLVCCLRFGHTVQRFLTNNWIDTSDHRVAWG